MVVGSVANMEGNGWDERAMVAASLMKAIQSYLFDDCDPLLAKIFLNVAFVGTIVSSRQRMFRSLSSWLRALASTRRWWSVSINSDCSITLIDQSFHQDTWPLTSTVWVIWIVVVLTGLTWLQFVQLSKHFLLLLFNTHKTKTGTLYSKGSISSFYRWSILIAGLT